MKERIIEILKEVFYCSTCLDTDLEEWTTRILSQISTKSLTNEISEDEIDWRPGMEMFNTLIDAMFIASPKSGPTKAELIGAWHESIRALSKSAKGVSDEA